MKNILTPLEVSLLVDSIAYLAFELGVRFLSDYLIGDLYFSKIEYSEHNLQRARVQFTLARNITERREELQSIIDAFLKE